MTTIQETASTYFRWWKEGLESLLPPRVRQVLLGIHDPVIIKLDTPFAEIGLINNNGEYVKKEVLHIDEDATAHQPSVRWINKMHRKHHPLLVQIPKNLGLTTNIILPSTAKRDLSKIIYYEIGRKTPFNADQVLFSYRILDIDKESGRMRVEINIVPIERANEILGWLNDRNLVPDIMILGSESAGSMLDIEELNLIPQEKRAAKSIVSSRFNTVLALCLFILVITALYLPVLYQEIEINKLNNKIDSVSHNASQVERLREVYERLVSENEFLQAKKMQSYPVISIIKNITRLFPDDTYLSRLDFSDNHVDLHGESINASSLIHILEDDEMFHNVEFKAPVTRSGVSERSRFHIAAELSGPTT